MTIGMAGDAFQIDCSDAAVIEQLREQLEPWVLDGQGLPGYRIGPPTPDGGMWVLIGAAGDVIARARSVEPIIRTLLRHLSVLDAPRTLDSARVNLNAVVRHGRALLIDPYASKHEVVAERQLDRHGLAIIDAPVLEIAVDEPKILPVETNHLVPDTDDVGHVNLGSEPIEVVVSRSSSERAKNTLAREELHECSRRRLPEASRASGSRSPPHGPT